MKYLLVILFTFLPLFGQYSLKPSKRSASIIDKMPKNSVADMHTIPQDTSYYAQQVEPMSSFKQAKLNKEFDRKYFKPWYLKKLDIPSKDLGWELRFIQKDKIYSAQRRLIPASTYKQWIHNANYKALNKKGFHAITIRRTSVKALPTRTNFYRDPQKVGEGFPFDYNQNSAYHINLPLFVSHFSLDKKWVFVQGSYTFGWVEVKDIAFVDKTFVNKFMTGEYAISIKDDLRLYDSNTKAVSLVKLGALFPIVKQGHIVARKGTTGYAKIEPLKIDAGLLATKPLPFKPELVARIAKEFYNEPYGWGGRNECRDCSATTRDFLAPFGIFLRRNSSKQANDGTSIHIKDIPKAKKKQTIIANAKPFRSLLYVPGHIVLYLGQHKGEPVIMHTYWGIRKNNGSKLVTGRTIITSTEPGKERRDIKESSKLIHTLQRIVNFD